MHYLNSHTVSSSSGGRSYGMGCTLPDAWAGKWFEYSERGDIAIGAKNISHKGECVHMAKDRYVFKDE